MRAQVNSVRKPWTPEEDAALILLVSEHGAVGSWPTITLSMEARTGKQCRERYVNHLDPEMKKTAWTSDEDNVIRDMFPEFGTKWSQYMVLLPGRSDNSIKNRYHMVSRNNFECCMKVKQVISHKRSKPSNDNDNSFEDTDADSNTDLSSADVNRARLQKLLAARDVLDQEILDLENEFAPNDTSPSLTSSPECDSITPPYPSNAEIYTGFTDEPAGEQDGGFDFDSAWLDDPNVSHNASHPTTFSTSVW